MRRNEAVLATVLTLLLLAGGGIVYFHDDPRPFTPSQALSEFRAGGGAGSAAPTPVASRPAQPNASSAAVPGSRPAAPQSAPTTAPTSQPRAPATPQARAAQSDVEPGVYDYATEGYEQIDVGGARHDYPTDSAVTYRRGGCGTVDVWQPLEGRVSTNTLCRGARGIEPRQSVQRREFYGQSETQDLVCSPGLALVPSRPVPGSTQRGECRSDDTLLRLTVRVIDANPAVVGGTRTQAVHLRVTGTLTGSTRGTTDREEWFTPAGLLLRVVAISDTDRDTAGGVVNYKESYRLALKSLRPQR